MVPHRDEVFVAGGQPTITYVERSAAHVELNLARAIATPNQIVSLSGPTKTGKTVLCRRVLGQRQFIWIDGGQIAESADFWTKVAFELNIPDSVDSGTQNTSTVNAGIGIAMIATAGGSQLYQSSELTKRSLDSMSAALDHMTREKIMLVIDDFHYLKELARVDLMRNVKGSVFNGLKVILLSVTHRVFDAIKAESELTGRFTAISMPKWSQDDLLQIPSKGFTALTTQYPQSIANVLCDEAQENPFLMQKFCWEICFDLKIDNPLFIGHHHVPEGYDLIAMFQRLSLDAGLPIYQRLAAGPQSRKIREKRPLKSGGVKDIYEAVMLALAKSGPKAVTSYEELRSKLSEILVPEKMPQKHEITSALKHLSTISKKIGAGTAIDWDESNREVNLVDPYLRFYLRWQVRDSN